MIIKINKNHQLQFLPSISILSCNFLILAERYHFSTSPNKILAWWNPLNLKEKIEYLYCSSKEKILLYIIFNIYINCF